MAEPSKWIPVRYSQGPPFPGAAIPSIRYPRITNNNNNHPSPKNSSIDQYSNLANKEFLHQVKTSQISFIAWKIRKIGEASADTAATEAHYMKGYYNLEFAIQFLFNQRPIWLVIVSSTQLLVNKDFFRMHGVAYYKH